MSYQRNNFRPYFVSDKCPPHRYSIVKKWIEKDTFFVIQRCRKCDVWLKREVDALSYSKAPTLTTQHIPEAGSQEAK